MFSVVFLSHSQNIRNKTSILFVFSNTHFMSISLHLPNVFQNIFRNYIHRRHEIWYASMRGALYIEIM